MSKAFEARRTHGSFAELAGDKAKPIVGACERCGAKLTRRGKRYCMPCANERYDETVAANKAKYKAAKQARTLYESSPSPTEQESEGKKE